jgi:predicted ferric reductase
LGWIRTVLRGTRVQLLSFHSHEPLNEQAMIKASGWIHGQVTYLAKRIREFRAQAETWKRLAIVLAISAVGVATADSLTSAPKALGSWVVVLLAALASALAYSNLIGYADTADRYSRSLRQFQRGQDALAAIELAPGTTDQERQIRRLTVVEAVGREKLDELNDWVAGQLQRVYAPGA